MVRLILHEICLIVKSGPEDFQGRCKDPTISQRGINSSLLLIQDVYCVHFSLV